MRWIRIFGVRNPKCHFGFRISWRRCSTYSRLAWLLVCKINDVVIKREIFLYKGIFYRNKIQKMSKQEHVKTKCLNSSFSHRFFVHTSSQHLMTLCWLLDCCDHGKAQTTAESAAAYKNTSGFPVIDSCCIITQHHDAISWGRHRVLSQYSPSPTSGGTQTRITGVGIGIDLTSIQTELWLLQQYFRPQLEVHARKSWTNSQLYQERAFIQATDRAGKFHVADSE
jgi:hypothetical protein